MATFTSEQKKLIIFMIFTGIFFVVELVVGEISNCTALVADSFHMLSDVVSQIIALVAMTLTPKKWSKNTYGFSRAGDFGALTNAIFLGALCLSIFIESIKKFFDPDEIDDPRLVFIVGCVGLAINLLGMYFFHGHAGHGHSHGGHGHSHQDHGHNHSHTDHSHEGCRNKDVELQNMSPTKDDNDPEQGSALIDSQGTAKKKTNSQLNVKGVYLHIMGDLFGSIVVIISSAISWLTDWEFKNYADPVISLLFVILIMISVLKLFKASSMIMLLSIPKGFHVEEVTDTIYEKFPDISNIHELHLWSLSSDKSVLSMHIKVKEEMVSSKQMILVQDLKDYLDKLGIHSSAIQVEIVKKGSAFESICSLKCPEIPKEENCSQLTCCLPGDKSAPECEKDPNSNQSERTSVVNENTPDSQHSKVSMSQVISMPE